MIERDYIMRMIQQFARFVAQIVSQKQSGSYEEALRWIDTSYTQLLGLDPILVELLSDKELLAALRPDEPAYAEKALIVARLLKEKAEILELQGDNEQTVAGLYVKSLSHYLEALASNEELRTEAHFEQIDSVRDKARPYELPDWSKANLLGYLETRGRFAEAEDVLFELVEDDYAGIAQEGVAFYRRLLEKSDAELAAGDLPRPEVEDGLRTLSNRVAKRE